MNLRIFLRAALLLAALTPTLLPARADHIPYAANRTFDVSAAVLLKSAPPASAYPNADAYWLRSETTVTLHADGTVREVCHETARLFNTRGLENADVSIPYTSASQTVTNVRARTILASGSVLPVEAADIHETSPYSEFTLYDDAKNVGFSLPGAEEGAVIDYQYTVLTHRPLRRGAFADTRWMIKTDPCRLNRYTLIAPAGMPVRFRAHNAAGVKFTQSLSADRTRRICRWERWNSPAFVSEPAMPAQETVAPWLEISTWPSWQGVAAWYRGLAAPRMTATTALTALARRLTAGRTTQREKAQALFYWVEKKTRYVAIEMGLSAYQPHSAAEVCRNRYGDCKDMTTLLATLFHAAGIATAWPALLNTESKRPVQDHLAMPGLFDHAILRADLDGEPYWFDATAEYCAFGDIPSADRGLEAFVVQGTRGAFETIPCGGPETNRMVYVKTVTLHPDGSAECRTTVHGDGDAALAARTELADLRPGQLRDHFEGMISSQTDATLRAFTLGGSENLGQPMTYGVQYTAPAWAARTGSLLIVSDAFQFTSPATLRRRRFPLLVESPQQEDYTAIVRLPPGCRVEALPNSVREETAAGTLSVTYTQTPGAITIHKVATLQPALISPEAYPALRAAFERFTQCLKAPIVLRQETRKTISQSPRSLSKEF